MPLWNVKQESLRNPSYILQVIWIGNNFYPGCNLNYFYIHLKENMRAYSSKNEKFSFSAHFPRAMIKENPIY